VWSVYGPSVDTGGLPANGARTIYPYPSIEALISGEARGGKKAVLPRPGPLPSTEGPPPQSRPISFAHNGSEAIGTNVVGLTPRSHGVSPGGTRTRARSGSGCRGPAVACRRGRDGLAHHHRADLVRSVDSPAPDHALRNPVCAP